MPRRASQQPPKDAIAVKGFVRLCLRNVRTGEESLTPWVPNAITAYGFEKMICGNIGGIAGSRQISHLQLATQTTAANSTQESASGEFDTRKAATLAFSGNGTIQATASWATNEGNDSEVGAIAIYGTDAGGTAGSIAIFTTSQKTTDQELRASYAWRFSQA